MSSLGIGMASLGRTSPGGSVSLRCKQVSPSADLGVSFGNHVQLAQTCQHAVKRSGGSVGSVSSIHQPYSNAQIKGMLAHGTLLQAVHLGQCLECNTDSTLTVYSALYRFPQ